MLTIVQSETGDVLKLTGRFDGIGASTFDQFVRSFESRSRPLILDLDEVEYVSSAGIRSLVQLGKRLLQNETRLVLAALRPFVQQTLATGGLLSRFAVFPSVAEALGDISPASSAFPQTRTCTIGGRIYTTISLGAPGARIEIWGGDAAFAGSTVETEALTTVTLSELPLSFGLGGLGNSRAEAAAVLGQFVSLGNTVIAVPADGECCPDFIQMDSPDAVSFCVASAAAINGDPVVAVSPAAASTTLEELAGDIPELLIATAGSRPAAAAFLLHGQALELRGYAYWHVSDIADFRQGSETITEQEDVVILGIMTSEDGNPCTRLREKEWSSVGAGCRMLAYGVRLSGQVDAPARCTRDELLKAVLDPDRFRGVLRIHPQTRLAKVRSWIFAPQSVIPGSESRMAIEAPGDMSFPDEWDVITRRIYSDCSRVVLTPMAGGYSAATFRADSFDRDGRRMIPTVLKISSLDNTTRERQAYHKYVSKFILNNSTVIMGHAERGSWAGLRYNFVGVNGPGSSLSWLADHYVRRPAAELIPLFESVFGEILWPWYGQPKREQVHPYAQHDPAEIFRDIPGTAERLLGVSPDDRFVACPELGVDLPNPYRFLKYEFPQRMGQASPWNTSITHGDLNLNNILLDEKENIWVIDFSETRPRNIVADFARLEPLLSIQMTRLEQPDDAAALLEFLAGLMEVSPLSGDPPMRYRGTDPMVEKSWQVINLLRRYARRVAGDEDQPVFYWLPLLQWTLPLVCFRQLDLQCKRISMYAAGLICRELAKQPT